MYTYIRAHCYYEHITKIYKTCFRYKYDRGNPSFYYLINNNTVIWYQVNNNQYRFLLFKWQHS